MFGKKKKESKKKKIDEAAANEEGLEKTEGADAGAEQNKAEMSEADRLIIGEEISSSEPEMSEEQQEKLEKLGSVKDKISKILKSSNIEIVDENFGDEYEYGSGAGSSAKQQQDYDSLKSLFGGKDEKKSKELTLTIDDFDYTYVGQYLDEFDMMHLKNIKRIRLQNKYAKLIKKISLISSLVLIVIAGAVTAFLLTRETPVYLKSITLNHTEGDYFINDYFDYAGLYIIAEYSDGRVERVKLSDGHLQDMSGNIVQNGKELQFTGTAPAELRFGYGGLSTSYVVHVENKRPSGLSVIYSDGLFNLSEGALINEEKLMIMLKYANFKSTYLEYDSRNVQLFINGEACAYSFDDKAFIASNSTKPAVVGENSTAVIKIVSNGYTLEFTDVDGQYFVETSNQIV